MVALLLSCIVAADCQYRLTWSDPEDLRSVIGQEVLLVYGGHWDDFELHYVALKDDELGWEIPPAIVTPEWPDHYVLIGVRYKAGNGAYSDWRWDWDDEPSLAKWPPTPGPFRVERVRR